MIGRLHGILLEKSPPFLLIDVGGVGYEVQVSMTTLYTLPDLGEKVTLLTHFVVREDAQLLYAFTTQEERQIFREIIKISGVGPRTALAILSGLSAQDLTQAVRTQEVGRLIKVPGIGKKTAERLLLELKGKLSAEFTNTASMMYSSANNDIMQALLALGYSEKEAQSALKALPPDIGVNDGIKLALKKLN